MTSSEAARESVTKMTWGLAVVATMSWLAPLAAMAQDADAFVLPRGTARLSGAGQYAIFDERFASGDNERLGSELTTPLELSSFPPLIPLAFGLETFFSSTQGSAGSTAFDLDPSAITFGTPDITVSLSSVRVPMRLDFGLAPRLQIGFMIPLVRGRQQIERFGFDGATVGLNPDPDRNADLLGRVGGNGATLGALPFLPTHESAAGQELQRRVQGATGGDTISLPRAALVSGAVLRDYLLNDLRLAELNSRASPWRPGDAEVEARFQLVDGVGGRLVPTDSVGTRFRAAIFGAVRIPTGTEPDTLTLFPVERDAGISGFRVGGVADLFIGDRWWLTVGARHSTALASDVLRRVTPRDAALTTRVVPEAVSWNPPDSLQVSFAPRIRLTELISVGAEYRGSWLGEGTFENDAGGAEVLNTASGVSHSIGFGARFTSIPAYADRRAALPLDVTIGYARVISGPPGSPAESTVRIEGSLIGRLWGAGLRRQL